MNQELSMDAMRWDWARLTRAARSESRLEIWHADRFAIGGEQLHGRDAV